jgi:hypothetical protein
MPASRSVGLRGVTAAVLAVPLAAVLLVAVPAAPAEASLGSVPVVVSDYVSGGGMVARLEELYGPGRKGAGVEFDQTTKPGPISRVYEWTDDRYAHPHSDHPIQLTNYWTVPITISGKAVGVAAVWINPRNDAPELAQFTASAALATALANVPADAALVHDAATSAWFGVAGATANPLVPGRSGVTTATPVADLALRREAAPTTTGGGANPEIGLAVGVLALLIAVIAVALLLPGWLRRRPVVEPLADAAPQAAAPEPAGPKPADQKPAAPEPPASRPAATKPATEKPAAAKPAAAKPAERKPSAKAVAPNPAASKPRAPRTAADASRAGAAAKPRTTPVSQKPAASKPTGTGPKTSRPATSKPAASKPPRARPPKPPQDDPADE